MKGGGEGRSEGCAGDGDGGAGVAGLEEARSQFPWGAALAQEDR